MSDYIGTPDLAKSLSREAHQVYLDNWETKTQFAENDCKWNSEIHHRSHEAIENLASTVDVLALFLSEALARIEELEKHIKNQ